ncbi:MAG: DUF3126 family protein [Pseudomonadota bacterium]
MELGKLGLQGRLAIAMGPSEIKEKDRLFDGRSALHPTPIPALLSIALAEAAIFLLSPTHTTSYWQFEPAHLHRCQIGTIDHHGLINGGHQPVTKSEITRLQAYLRATFGNTNLHVHARTTKDDSVEVTLGEEFIGVIFKDEEDGETSYAFQMAILDIDLPQIVE